MPGTHPASRGPFGDPGVLGPPTERTPGDGTTPPTGPGGGSGLGGPATPTTAGLRSEQWSPTHARRSSPPASGVGAHTVPHRRRFPGGRCARAWQPVRAPRDRPVSTWSAPSCGTAPPHGRGRRWVPRPVGEGTGRRWSAIPGTEGSEHPEPAAVPLWQQAEALDRRRLGGHPRSGVVGPCAVPVPESTDGSCECPNQCGAPRDPDRPPNLSAGTDRETADGLAVPSHRPLTSRGGGASPNCPVRSVTKAC